MTNTRSYSQTAFHVISFREIYIFSIELKNKLNIIDIFLLPSD